MPLVKTEIEGILRDVETGALLNSNDAGLSAYKKMKQRNIEIDMMKDKIKEIDHIKEELNDIKSLLTKIAEKL